MPKAFCGRNAQTRCGVAALAALLLMAAAPMDPAAQEKIAAPYRACLDSAAKRLDDGKTDVAAMGEAVAAACRPELLSVIAALGKDLSAAEQDAIRQSQMNAEHDYGAVAVEVARYGR